GVAGFAKGGAKVRLADDGDGTLLSYDVNASVGGKLAQIGARLIDSTAKKLADDFFAKFGQLAAAKAAALPTAAPTPPAPAPAPVQVTPPPASATVPPAPIVAAQMAAKPDPLSAHQPISFGGWLAMIAVLIVIVFGLWLIG
ncbi:MAG: hypothetical protein KDE14_16335, partial [Rhodobacteraceae bacterium]|nr:hypothetical protein [Paracoccaceae bacterium]